MSVMDDMDALASGSVEQVAPNAGSWNKDPTNDKGGSIYEALKVTPDAMPEPGMYYTIAGWFKPGSTEAIKMCANVSNVLARQRHVLRISSGEFSNPMFEAWIKPKPIISVITPFSTYEPKGYTPPAEFVSNAKIAPEVARVCAAYDKRFNNSGRGYQVFSIARIASLLGVDLKNPSKYLILYTWYRETSAADISQNTNPAVATMLRIAADAGIPVYNLNHKESRDLLLSKLKEVDEVTEDDIPY